MIFFTCGPGSQTNDSHKGHMILNHESPTGRIKNCGEKSAFSICKVSKGAKIRNRYNQIPHLTQDTNGKVINLQFDTTNENQEVSPFPADDHKAQVI